MKIIVAAHSARAGGGITYLLNILKYLAAAEKVAEMVVYCNSRFEKELINYGLQCNPKITISRVRILDQNILLRLLWFYFILPSKMLKSAGDIFFSPGGTLPFLLPRAIVKIVVCQNLQPFHPNAIRNEKLYMSWKLRINKLLLLDSFRRADGIVLLTEYAKSLLHPLLAKTGNKSITVPHGVEAEFYRRPEGEKNESAGANNYCQLLYVSSLKSYKRHAELLGAIKKLVDKGYRKLKLTLIGTADKPIIARVGELIEKYQLKDVVEYRGEIALSKMPEIYKASDIFVFPSACESFALPLLEAMAAGLPVLSSNYPPMTEILRNAAFYFDPDDETSIANAIEELLLSPDRCRALSAIAYKRAHQFSWAKSVNRLSNFFMELAQKRARPTL